MTIHSVTFVHPAFLIVGLACAAAIIALGVRLDRQRSAALATFGSRRRGAASSLSRPLRIFKRGLLVLAVLFGCTALARPQRGFRWEEAHRQGIDLLFAIDTSKSMLAPDLKPDRLTRAKLAVRDLVGKFEGDRIGLVAFSGDAFLQSPLTLDRDMFGQTLDAVDTNMIARGGTDVGRAIEVSRAALQNEPANQKLLVLLTDGEDLEQHALDAAKAAAKDGVRIFTVGVGTPGGELIPVVGAPGTFMHDESGAFVRSQLDENGLRAIAAATGGDYRGLGADGHGLEALYRDVLAKLPRESLGSRVRQVPLERYQWPLGLSILFFALEPLIRERRRSASVEQEPQMRGPKFAVFRHRAATAAAMGLALFAARSAHASPRSAERAYHDGKFAESAKAYEQEVAGAPNDAKLQFNLGAAAYKSGDYGKASAALDHSLHAGPVELQQSAYYDLGNTQFRAGEKTVEQEPSQTIEQWKKAIASYEAAIKLEAKDADAVYNRDLVKRKLAALEQKQKRKQDEKNKQQQAQNDKQKPNASGKPDKGGQGQQDHAKQDKQGQQDQAKQDKQGQPPQNQQAQNQQGQSEPGQQAQPKPGPQGHEGQQAKGATPKQPGQAQPGQEAQNQPQSPKPDQQAAGDAQSSKEAKQAHGTAQADDDAAEPKVPGQLSRKDAKALLDSLRADERLMTAAPKGPKHVASDDVPRKDW